MRVYHFVSARFGLDDIRRRRLKIAILSELNDPFEFYGADLRDPIFRAALRQAREEYGKTRGFLCFSRKSDNPVQWSHYADKHAGLCLGFDVADHLLAPIIYARRRAAVHLNDLVRAGRLNSDAIKQMMFTKYSHWRYEREVRALVHLDTRDPRTGLFFADFSEQLRLVRVIVGAQSQVTRRQLARVLGTYVREVEVSKARLAFRSFRVVRQRNAKLWL